MASTLSKSESYKRFRSSVALNRITLDLANDKVWTYYDHGPKDAGTPLVMIPGASGSCDVFFKQIVTLCPKGYRLISASAPAYMTHDEWVKGFDRFLDKLLIGKAHMMGTSLGGYLIQCYCQYRPKRVVSLILNNTFCDTSYYNQNAPCLSTFYWMPEFLLKRMILSNFPMTAVEEQVADSINFMVEVLESLTQADLASKLTLNCTLGNLDPLQLQKHPITIIDTLDDDTILPAEVRESVHKAYPDSKKALIKTGGNFPYLSRVDEFNLYVEVHLRNAVEWEKHLADAESAAMKAAAGLSASASTSFSPSSPPPSRQSPASHSSSPSSAAAAAASVSSRVS